MTLKQDSMAGSHLELTLYTLGFMYSAGFLQCLVNLFHHRRRKRTERRKREREHKKK